MELSISHADESTFERDGLRVFFEYRDLGVKQATGGRAGAHVIRAIPDHKGKGGVHRHGGLEFQLVYVLRGWVRFWYDGRGEVLLKPGSCVHQPPGIVHQEVDHSDDLELLEITLPAEFSTEETEPGT